MVNAASVLGELALTRGQIVRLRSTRGMRVRVASGRVWFTEENRADDLWLGAGESARLTGSGLALIEAVEASRASVA